jgi:restriction system protein
LQDSNLQPSQYDAKAEPLYRHSRPVKWLNLDIACSTFDRDLLFAVQVLTTICQIEKNNAEKRVRARC